MKEKKILEIDRIAVELANALPAPHANLKMAVVIPAKNEEQGITKLKALAFA